ncbi:MAG TPA: DUF1844 domain-containing protein [Candidatus Binatia bacterium]|jgi:hypothetical protein
MAEEGEKGEGKGFKVADRRRFSPETGEPREAAATAEGRSEAEEPRNDEIRGEAQNQSKDEANAQLPEINFSTFVISLSTQALMHLGEIADPTSGKVESNLPVAKQMIDIIGVLKDKTRGNLDPGEQQLMEDVLYDLRMRYVEAVKKKK